VECDFLSDLSIYPRIFLSVLFVSSLIRFVLSLIRDILSFLSIFVLCIYVLVVLV